MFFVHIYQLLKMVNKKIALYESIARFLTLRNEQRGELRKPPGMYLLVKFAFVSAVGGVGFEDVAVSGFKFFQNAGFVHNSGSAVIGECAEKNRVFRNLCIEIQIL